MTPNEIMTLVIVTMVSTVVGAPLSLLGVAWLMRNVVTARELHKIVNEADRKYGKNRLDTLNDLTNIERNQKDQQRLRSYKRFIRDHGTTEIDIVHKTLLESGVKKPSKQMTVAQVVAAKEITEALRDRDLPSVEWEHHPIASHVVLNVNDKDVLLSIIESGHTDYSAAMGLLEDLRNGGSPALMDGFL